MVATEINKTETLLNSALHIFHADFKHETRRRSMANPVHMQKRNRDLIDKYKEVYGFRTVEGTLGVMFDFIRENEFAMNEFFKKMCKPKVE